MRGRIAVLIKTLDREEALVTCLRSVRERLREQGIDHRIYLADDGPVPPGKRSLYDDLRERGHAVLELEERVGASAARNRLLGRLEDEPLVLRMDDDFELTDETDIAAMQAVLEDVPELGAVGDLERQVGDGKGVFSGQISDGQGFFERRDGTLVRRLLPPDDFEWERAGGHRYARCDFTRNLLLIRRAVFDDVRWEERLPFAGEHEDFMLQLAAADWGVAFTPDSVHSHRDDLARRGRSTRSGEPARRRAKRAAMEVYREKWGIERKTVRRTPARTLRAAVVRAKLTAAGWLGAAR